MPDLDDFDLRPGDPRDSGRTSSRATAFDDEPLDESVLAEPLARSPGAGSPPSQQRPVRSRESRRAVGVGIALGLAALLVIAFWTLSRRVELPPPGTKNEPPPPAVAANPVDEAPRSNELEARLPPLDESDALVRELVGTLSSNSALAGWLGNSNLIRIFAAVVENVSLGGSPAANLRFLQPRDPYRAVANANGRQEWVPDPASYRRFDLVTTVFLSIDPQAAAEVYRRLHGLLQEAYADLGYPDESIDTALATAFQACLATPVPAIAPLLERSVDTYRYADPRLEELSAAQKLLLRLGPDHQQRVQAQIRRLAVALELDVD